MEKGESKLMNQKRCQLSGTSCNIVAARFKLSRQETFFPPRADDPAVTSPNVGWVEYGRRTRSQASVLPRSCLHLISVLRFFMLCKKLVDSFEKAKTLCYRDEILLQQKHTKPNADPRLKFKMLIWDGWHGQYNTLLHQIDKHAVKNCNWWEHRRES